MRFLSTISRLFYLLNDKTDQLCYNHYNLETSPPTCRFRSDAIPTAARLNLIPEHIKQFWVRRYIHGSKAIHRIIKL